LGRRLFPEVVVTGPEVDVRGMDDPEHRAEAGLQAIVADGVSAMADPQVAGSPGGMARARRPHDSPLADSDDRPSL
jgi:hypothetical protein